MARGNVFDGISILDIPPGLQLFLQFGNNPRIGPLVSAISITFTNVNPSDVAEGVWAEIDAAAPGAIVPGWVSYALPGQRGAAGGISAMGI